MIELPMGYWDDYHKKRYKFMELRRLDAEDLIVIGKKETKQNPHNAALFLCQEGVTAITNEDATDKLEDHTRKLQFLSYSPDLMFILTELIRKVKGDLVETCYLCGNARCGEEIRFDKTKDNDNRENLSDIKLEILNDLGDGNTFEFIAEDVEDLVEDEDFGKLKEFVFEYPTFKSYSEAHRYTDNPILFQRDLLYRSLKSVNSGNEDDLKKLKTVYGRKLVPRGVNDYERLLNMTNVGGYRFDDHVIKCSCGYSNYGFDFTNFFGSILPKRSNRY